MTTKIKIENMDQTRTVRATTYDVVRTEDGTPTDDWAPAEVPKPVDLEPGKSCELWIHDSRFVRVEEV